MRIFAIFAMIANVALAWFLFAFDWPPLGRLSVAVMLTGMAGFVVPALMSRP
jgi:hypothetical protein